MIKRDFRWLVVLLLVALVIPPNIVIAAQAPTVVTRAATDITPMSGYIAGAVTSMGSMSIIGEVGLLMGSSSSNMFKQELKNGVFGPEEFGIQYTQLLPNTTYYYQAYARYQDFQSGNPENQYVYGSILSFKTTAQPTRKVEVVTGDSTNITSDGATLYGTLKDDGGVSTEYGFYILNSYGIIATVKAIPTGSSGSYYGVATGLNANMSYTYCAYAKNSLGQFEGTRKSFRTLVDSESIKRSIGEDILVTTVGFASGDSLNSVTSNLTFPSRGSRNNSSIVWRSSNTSIVSNSGVVTRPSGGDVRVDLTGTFTLEGQSIDTSLTVTVKAKEVPVEQPSVTPTTSNPTVGYFSVSPTSGSSSTEFAFNVETNYDARGVAIYVDGDIILSTMKENSRSGTTRVWKPEPLTLRTTGSLTVTVYPLDADGNEVRTSSRTINVLIRSDEMPLVGEDFDIPVEEGAPITSNPSPQSSNISLPSSVKSGDSFSISGSLSSNGGTLGSVEVLAVSPSGTQHSVQSKSLSGSQYSLSGLGSISTSQSTFSQAGYYRIIVRAKNSGQSDWTVLSDTTLQILPKDIALPAINSFTSSSSSGIAGSSGTGATAFVFTITTNTEATGIALYDGYNTLAGINSASSSTGTTKTWKSSSLYFASSGTHTITAYPLDSNRNEIMSAGKTLSISLSGVESPSIQSVSVNPTSGVTGSLNTGTNFVFTIVTNKETAKVAMYQGDLLLDLLESPSTSGGTKTWKTSAQSFFLAGKTKITFYPSDEKGIELRSAGKAIEITLTENESLNEMDLEDRLMDMLGKTSLSLNDILFMSDEAILALPFDVFLTLDKESAEAYMERYNELYGNVDDDSVRDSLESQLDEYYRLFYDLDYGAFNDEDDFDWNIFGSLTDWEEDVEDIEDDGYYYGPLSQEPIVLTIGSSNVYKGSSLLSAPPVTPMIVNGRTMLPFRYLCQDVFGGTVDYNHEQKLITTTIGSTTIVMTINNVFITVNGKQVILDQPPILSGDYTVLPLRGFEAIASFAWDPVTSTVTIYPK